MSAENDGPEGAGDAKDAIEVVRHVARPLREVWGRLAQPEGVEAFLGQGAQLGLKGDPWQAADGTRGVTRSYHPEEQVRVSWHADEAAPPTLVDLQLAADGDGTTLVLRHEHLTDDLDREALTRRWQDAIERLTSTA